MRRLSSGRAIGVALAAMVLAACGGTGQGAFRSIAYCRDSDLAVNDGIKPIAQSEPVTGPA